MALILLVLGILLAGVGGGLIGFAIPFRDLALGTTLILAGTIALVGGLVMTGLSAAVAELTKIANSLRARQGARPARAPAEPVAAPAELSARDAPALPGSVSDLMPPESRQVPAPSVDVSASAIERLRSSIPRSERSVPMAEEVPLSPNGQPQQAEPPAPTPAPSGAAPGGDGAREPRLDFLFRQRSTTRPTPQPESFDALWPKRSGRESQADARTPPRVEPKIEPRLEEKHSAAAAAGVGNAPAVVEAQVQTESTLAAPADAGPRSVAILKSGVVDGMAYTLYADGSIEAQLSEGTVRFGSIAELRAHIEKNS